MTADNRRVSFGGLGWLGWLVIVVIGVVIVVVVVHHQRNQAADDHARRCAYRLERAAEHLDDAERELLLYAPHQFGDWRGLRASSDAAAAALLRADTWLARWYGDCAPDGAPITADTPAEGRRLISRWNKIAAEIAERAPWLVE